MVPQSGAALKSQPTYSQPVSLNGRTIGQVRAGVFSKTVCATKHFLRQPKAICFDRCTLRDAEAAGAVRVEVRDQETGRVYSAPLETIWTHCFPVQRGYGDQLGLGLDYWSVNGAQPKAEARAAETNEEIAALQSSLFDLEVG